MSHYIECLKGLPCFLDDHNVEYKILERCADLEGHVLKKMVLYDQSCKMKKFEMMRLQKCKRYFTVSKDDLNILEELAQGKVQGAVIPNGVDTRYFHISSHDAPALEDALAFTGSMDWFPNEDAVMYFSDEILPLIWKEKPHVKFYIIGKSPSEKMKELSRKDSRIIVTGRVDDVRLLMARAKVFIVPIRVAGGTRLKILEAMSMRQSIVSTTIGAEGIKHTNGKDILLADTPEDFAQKTILLLNDPIYRDRLAEAGRELVCRLYDWDIIGQNLKNIYHEALHA
jgi:glycosyltransferase involved in cell wall biosynthesis